MKLSFWTIPPYPEYISIYPKHGGGRRKKKVFAKILVPVVCFAVIR